MLTVDGEALKRMEAKFGFVWLGCAKLKILFIWICLCSRLLLSLSFSLSSLFIDYRLLLSTVYGAGHPVAPEGWTLCLPLGSSHGLPPLDDKLYGHLN